MPMWMPVIADLAVRSRMAWSFRAAAARVVSIAVARFGADLFQPGHLGWVDPEEGASDTGIFMRTWGPEVAAAGSEGYT